MNVQTFILLYGVVVSSRSVWSPPSWACAWDQILLACYDSEHLTWTTSESGDSNKSIIFTCGLRFLSGSDVQLVCVCHLFGGVGLSLLGALPSFRERPVWKLSGWSDNLPWHALPPRGELPTSLLWLHPSAQLADIPRNLPEFPYSLVSPLARAGNGSDSF